MARIYEGNVDSIIYFEVKNLYYVLTLIGHVFMQLLFHNMFTCVINREKTSKKVTSFTSSMLEFSVKMLWTSPAI